MTTARITKIVCPSCRGSGLFLAEDFACQWCCGTGRVPVQKAHRYADITYCYASAGYVNGDLPIDEAYKMEREAERVYELTGHKAPWLKREAHV